MGNPDLNNLLSFFKSGSQSGFHNHTPRSLVELRAMQLLCAILNKPEWWTKAANADIRERWAHEAAAQGLPPSTVAYVLAQVQYLAAHDVAHTVHGATLLPGPVLNTVVSPDAVPLDLKQRLRAQVAVLEDIPESHKDWHPGSNKQVLDLVHPSLYCLVYNQTLIKLSPSNTLQRVQPPWDQFVGSGHQVARLPRRAITGPDCLKSRKFQWLPTEIVVDQAGKPHVKSYINNLHPVHNQDLYQTLMDVLERFLPMFEKQLTLLNAPQPGPALDVDMYNIYTGDEPDADEMDEDEYEQAMANRPIAELSMPDTYTPHTIPASSHVSLNGRRLQVIFKLANIHLTPENPEFGGGSWHIEGTANESIIATGIYYYDCHNVQDVPLEFRTAVDSPDYEQSDDRGVEAVYGLHDGDPLNQHLGSVTTREGLCLVFPNIYQHHVPSFELLDKTQPGHRKILVFFLVDPSKTIVSTAAVPPQQIWWYTDALSAARVLPLPAEIIRCIAQFVGGLQTVSEAKEVREKLMEERRGIVLQTDDQYFQEPFSLCEH